MNILEVIAEIDRQSRIQKSELESYQQEICEVIVFDTIYQYWTSTQNFKNPNQINSSYQRDENWATINAIYCDWISGEVNPNIPSIIFELFERYYKAFYF